MRFQTLEEVEAGHIYRVLTYHNGNKSLAANILGISLKTLYNKLHRYNMFKHFQPNEPLPKGVTCQNLKQLPQLPQS